MQTSRDLSFLYASNNDPQISKDSKKAIKAIKHFAEKRKNNKTYKKDPKVLCEALDEYAHIYSTYYYGTKVSVYHRLQTQLTQDTQIKAQADKSEHHSTQLFLQLQFFELALGKITQKNQKIMLKHKKLKPYHHYLHKIFTRAKHNLSAKEEKIITLLVRPSLTNRKRMTSDFFAQEVTPITDFKGQKQNLSFEELMTRLSNPDTKTRHTAARHLNKIFLKHAPVATRELNNVLEYRHVMDQLRGFTRPDQSRHLSDDVPTTVVDTLIEVTQAHHQLAHDFYALKAQLLGKRKLAYHERNVPVIFGTEPEYSFKQAQKIIHKTFGKLDPEFALIFQQFLANGQIDVFPAVGKSGGAFHVGIGKPYPGLVLLNYTNKLQDLTTLAHEMGHALNTHYVARKQHALDYGYGMFTAEVASTFMEDFVYDSLLAQADDQTKLTMLMYKLNDFVSTVIRQIACYTCEQELHTAWREQGFLSTEHIGKIFTKHMSAYMGPAVTQSAGSENRWTYRSHLRYYFYVYSYAGGLLISKALQNKVRQNPNFVQIYKNTFLPAGNSESPQTTFGKMGIDITDENFRQQGFTQAYEMLTQAQSLAQKLK